MKPVRFHSVQFESLKTMTKCDFNFGEKVHGSENLLTVCLKLESKNKHDIKYTATA